MIFLAFLFGVGLGACVSLWVVVLGQLQSLQKAKRPEVRREGE